MAKHLLLYSLIFNLLFAYNLSWSQGCSDAGFCTMGAMKPDQPYNKKIEFRLRTLEISFYRGSTPTPVTPVIYSGTADFNFSLSNKTSFQIKLPFQAVTGTLGDTQGLGDISLCFTRTVFTSEKFDINVSLGSKLPTNKADKDENGYPLPMYYQTSLGSYDIIAGVSLISRKWLFATGIQHAFNENGNQFLWSAWANGPEDISYVENYARAKELKRGTDVMMRLERNFRFSRLNFTLGLLPIYRITKDEFTDGTGKRVEQDGTTGLALSGIFTTGYNFNVRTGIKALLGFKITQRDVNPDGLTRHMVTTIGYFYRF